MLAFWFFFFLKTRKPLCLANIENIDWTGHIEFVHQTSQCQGGLPGQRELPLSPPLACSLSSPLLHVTFHSALVKWMYRFCCLPSSDSVDKQLNVILTKKPWRGVVLMVQASAKPRKQQSQRFCYSWAVLLVRHIVILNTTAVPPKWSSCWNPSKKTIWNVNYGHCPGWGMYPKYPLYLEI